MGHQNQKQGQEEEYTWNVKRVVFVIALIITVVLLFCSFTVVKPGNRGVKVTLGSVSDDVVSEGLVIKSPITSIKQISIRFVSSTFPTECYSSDLQQIKGVVSIMYAIPSGSVVKIYKNYSGDVFNQFVVPLVHEAFKEVTSKRSAERVIKDREIIKGEVVQSLKGKLEGLVTIQNIAISDLSLTPVLERAIELKMVQEQEAAQAKFAQEKTRTEAQTAAIRAEGEARAIDIRGRALKDNKDLISLQIVEKWDGKTPQTVVISGGNSPANILLPIK